MPQECVKVSVIIPCYNDGEYLAQAVASVNLEKNADTEIVIVDDGSEDAITKSIVQSMAGERIRVIFTEHSGPSNARNVGIRQARGCYILPLDADDKIEPAYIGAAAKILDERPGVGIVYCHADQFGEENGPWLLPKFSIERMLLDNVIFVTAMFRREDWERCGGFCTDMAHGMEDYDFFLSILEMGRQVVQLPDVFFHYYNRKKSRTRQFEIGLETVKMTYQQIYDRHEPLYEAHMREYIRLLREEVLQQRFERRQLVQATEFLRRVKKIPLLNWLGHHILCRKE